MRENLLIFTAFCFVSFASNAAAQSAAAALSGTITDERNAVVGGATPNFCFRD